jgi:hypothetical protein
MVSSFISKNFLDLIQSAGVIFTIYLAIRQTRDNNEIYRSQIFNNLYQRLDQINSLAITNEKLSITLMQQYDTNELPIVTVNAYVDMVGTFFYEMHYHYKKGLLSESEWRGWENTIKDFYIQPYVLGYTKRKLLHARQGFDEYLFKLVNELEKEKKENL